LVVNASQRQYIFAFQNDGKIHKIWSFGSHDAFKPIMLCKVEKSLIVALHGMMGETGIKYIGWICGV